jgi:epoxyqueuosine reductase QueG
MKEFLKTELVKFVKDYSVDYNINDIWREPLICFTDVYSPYVRNLSLVVNKNHVMPEKFLNSATVVIVYYLPFSKDVIDSNAEYVINNNNFASPKWADAYIHTDKLMKKISSFLIDCIQRLGYEAIQPYDISMDEETLMSCWSHRHLAYAGGLGTFGINNMLITKNGCSGRYGSLVSNIPVVPDKQLEVEYCIYKRTGQCKKCVENCPSKALSESGFDRFLCYEQCKKNIKVYGVDVCGKCATGIPCSFCAPSIDL